MALLKDGTRIYGNATVDTTLTTGNITLTSGIDASLIMHEPDSSGDGNGYSTLQLIPDGNLIGGGQYLIVDPTAGGHIHIRAGGAQDNSPANLILGGENSWFQVYAGLNPTVAISSNTHVWTFGTDSVLTLPGEGVIRSYDDTVILQSYDTIGSIGRGIRVGTNGNLYFEMGANPAWLTIGNSANNAVLSANLDLNLESGISGNVSINANNGNVWTFQGSGTLSWPDGTIQSTAPHVSSGYDAYLPNVAVDNIRASMDGSGNPTIAAVSGTFTSDYSLNATLHNGATYSITAYGSQGATFTSLFGVGVGVTFAYASDTLVGTFTNRDTGNLYRITWMAGPTGPSTGYGTITIEKLL